MARVSDGREQELNAGAAGTDKEHAAQPKQGLLITRYSLQVCSPVCLRHD